MARSTKFRITGTISEEETGRPLADLVVRAFDKDVFLDDKLGFATTGPDGGFEIRYDESAFRDVIERRPDVYLHIYDSSGQRLLHETRPRRNASRDERFQIRISGTKMNAGR